MKSYGNISVDIVAFRKSGVICTMPVENNNNNINNDNLLILIPLLQQRKKKKFKKIIAI